MDQLNTKNEDCYFFYYSTCSKGGQCLYRHEPAAMGSETACVYWQQGQCKKAHCPFRHMELKKNRNQILCYWEAQPTGCLKPHCPFMHIKSKDKPPVTGVPSKESVISEPSPAQVAENGSETKEAAKTVDIDDPKGCLSRVVVSLGEESDGESLPPNTPSKKRTVSPELRIKSLEEIRLERIQKEDAAVYSYPSKEIRASTTTTKQLFTSKNRLGKKENIDHSKTNKSSPKKDFSSSSSSSSDFHIKTLDEIRAERSGRTGTHATPTDDPTESSFALKITTSNNNAIAPDAKPSTNTTTTSTSSSPGSLTLDYKPRKLKVKRSSDAPANNRPVKLKRVSSPDQEPQVSVNPILETKLDRTKSPDLTEMEADITKPVQNDIRVSPVRKTETKVASETEGGETRLTDEDNRDSTALDDDSLWDEELGDDKADVNTMEDDDDDLLLEIDNMLGT